MTSRLAHDLAHDLALDLALGARMAVFGMEMTGLSRNVEGLVQAAQTEIEPRALRKHVEAVLDGFGAASAGEQKAALRSLGRGLAATETRGAQVLALALGALVEGGAAPELVWPAARAGLDGILDRATSFAEAAIKRAKTPDVETAIADSGEAVAQKSPASAHAWNAAPARCLTAIACLTRSKAIRARARKDEVLVAACWPLSDVVSEIGLLLQAIRIVDDETWLVLAPDLGRGFRVTVDSVASNAELYVLLADALVGDPRVGRIPGKRPDARAVEAIRKGEPPKKAGATATVPFHLVGWPAIETNGTLAPADPDHAEHWAWIEGIPADIPFAGKERVVLLQAPAYDRPVPIAPSFESLRPSVKLKSELGPAEVKRALLTLARAKAAATADAAPARGRSGAGRRAREAPKSVPPAKPAAKKPPKAKPAAKKVTKKPPTGRAPAPPKARRSGSGTRAKRSSPHGKRSKRGS